MAKTSIQWTENVWNPVTGCSEGCKWCYAREFAKRLQKNPKTAHKYRNGFKPTFHPECLDEPLRNKKPTTYFVCSMGEFQDPKIHPVARMLIYKRIKETPEHTYIILTKRPKEMLEEMIHNTMFIQFQDLKNLIRGVSITNQPDADERIPILLQIPAACRGVSLEPMMGEVELKRIKIIGSDDVEGLKAVTPLDEINALTGSRFYKLGGGHLEKYGGKLSKLGWVIVGGMTGPAAKDHPLNPNDVRKVRDDCKAAGVPFFFKSWGDWIPAESDGWWSRGTPFSGHSIREMKRYKRHDWNEKLRSYRVGKKAAGRMLDGRTHDEMPEVRCQN